MRCVKGVLGPLVLMLLVAACDDSPTEPSSGALVTFEVGDQNFRVWLTTPEQIAAVRAAQSGGPARIPNGRIAAGPEFNTGWSWHLEEVTFAESTIELCDGRPSDVEAAGTDFGGGRYCPWSATVVKIDEK